MHKVYTVYLAPFANRNNASHIYDKQIWETTYQTFIRGSIGSAGGTGLSDAFPPFPLADFFLRPLDGVGVLTTALSWASELVLASLNSGRSTSSAQSLLQFQNAAGITVNPNQLNAPHTG